MFNPLTKKITNHSNENSFSFSFFCDRCGKEWKSKIVPFNNGGFSLIERDEAQQLLWTESHRAAFNEANLEAHFHFNHCSKCSRWVCSDCLASNDSKEEFLCIDCEAREE